MYGTRCQQMDREPGVTLIADPELRIVPRYHGAHKRQRLDYWRGGLWRLHGISPFDQRIHRRNRS